MVDKNENDIRNIVALFDQQNEFLKDFAKPLYTFYSTLVQQGFSESQAMEILITYIKTLFGNIGKQ